MQPDSIIPDPGSAKGFDRYAYVNNNPINFNDPSGHGPCDGPYRPDSCDVQDSKRDSTDTPPNAATTSNQDPQTIADKAMNGDLNAIMQLSIPSFVGYRAEFQLCLIVFCLGGGQMGIYSINDGNYALTVDGLGGVGPSILPEAKLGIIATVGPIIGWNSSSIDDSTTGLSEQVGGFAAAGFGMAISASSPIIKTDPSTGAQISPADPKYGLAPTSIYVGFGAGLGAGAGASASYIISRNLNPFSGIFKK